MGEEDILLSLAYETGRQFAFAVEQEVKSLLQSSKSILVFPPLRERYFDLLVGLCNRYDVQVDTTVLMSGTRLGVVQRNSSTKALSESLSSCLQRDIVKLSDFFCFGCPTKMLPNDWALEQQRWIEEVNAIKDDDSDFLGPFHDFSRYVQGSSSGNQQHRRTYIECTSLSTPSNFPASDDLGENQRQSFWSSDWALNFGGAKQSCKTLGVRFTVDGSGPVGIVFGSPKHIVTAVTMAKHDNDTWSIKVFTPNATGKNTLSAKESGNFIALSGHVFQLASMRQVRSASPTPFWVAVSRAVSTRDIVFGTGVFPRSPVVMWTVDPCTMPLEKDLGIGFVWGTAVEPFASATSFTKKAIHHGRCIIRGIQKLGTLVPLPLLPCRTHILEVGLTVRPLAATTAPTGETTMSYVPTHCGGFLWTLTDLLLPQQSILMDTFTQQSMLSALCSYLGQSLNMEHFLNSVLSRMIAADISTGSWTTLFICHTPRDAVRALLMLRLCVWLRCQEHASSSSSPSAPSTSGSDPHMICQKHSSDGGSCASKCVDSSVSRTKSTTVMTWHHIKLSVTSLLAPFSDAFEAILARLSISDVRALVTETLRPAAHLVALQHIVPNATVIVAPSVRVSRLRSLQAWLDCFPSLQPCVASPPPLPALPPMLTSLDDLLPFVWNPSGLGWVPVSDGLLRRHGASETTMSKALEDWLCVMNSWSPKSRQQLFLESHYAYLNRAKTRSLRGTCAAAGRMIQRALQQRNSSVFFFLSRDHGCTFEHMTTSLSSVLVCSHGKLLVLSEFDEAMRRWAFGTYQLRCLLNAGLDAHLVHFFEYLPAPADGPCVLFGVFDGHGGPQVAQFVARHLVEELLKIPDLLQGRFDSAFRAAYIALDTLLGQDIHQPELEWFSRVSATEESTSTPCPYASPPRVTPASVTASPSQTPVPKSRSKGSQRFRSSVRLGGRRLYRRVRHGGRRKKAETDSLDSEEVDVQICGTSLSTTSESFSAAVSDEAPDMTDGEIAVNRVRHDSDSVLDRGRITPDTGSPSLRAIARRQLAYPKILEASPILSSSARHKPSPSSGRNATDDGAPATVLAPPSPGDRHSEQQHMMSSGDSQPVSVLQGLKSLLSTWMRAGNGATRSNSSTSHGLAVLAGCTAISVLVTGSQVIVANAGDSRAVLCRGTVAIELSKDHKPTLSEEKVLMSGVYTCSFQARIYTAGGWLEMGRVNGNLNLSRALGDLVYKMNSNLPPEKQIVSAVPDVVFTDIQSDDEFLVIGCDGIWESSTSQEIVDFIRSRINRVAQLSHILEALFEELLSPNPTLFEHGCDNMTAIIVDLQSSSRSAHALTRTTSTKVENPGDNDSVPAIVTQSLSPDQQSFWERDTVSSPLSGGPERRLPTSHQSATESAHRLPSYVRLNSGVTTTITSNGAALNSTTDDLPTAPVLEDTVTSSTSYS